MSKQAQRDSVYNGRVNIMEPDMDTSSLFKMYDKIPVSDPASFRNATEGIWNSTALSDAFFSKENVQNIQAEIKNGVYKKSNHQYRICDQNEDTLKIIMRSIYLQNSKNQPDNITQQIKELNDIVIKYCVHQLYGEADGYIKYKRDVSTMSVPLSLPVSSSYKHKTLKLKPFF